MFARIFARHLRQEAKTHFFKSALKSYLVVHLAKSALFVAYVNLKVAFKASAVAYLRAFLPGICAKRLKRTKISMIALLANSALFAGYLCSGDQESLAHCVKSAL